MPRVREKNGLGHDRLRRRDPVTNEGEGALDDDEPARVARGGRGSRRDGDDEPHVTRQADDDVVFLALDSLESINDEQSLLSDLNSGRGHHVEVLK